jgi:hypothetical protein
VCGVSVLGETAGEHTHLMEMNVLKIVSMTINQKSLNILDNQRKKLKHFGQSSKKNFWQFGEQVGNRKTIFILNFLYSG